MLATASLPLPARNCLAALRASSPPLLFGLRLWAAVSLSLLVAFWLELDNPAWAAASAAIMCQPQLGASLRKGWFRVIGTAIGSVVIVVLAASFPQDRVGFLALLALWGGICAFGATILQNFASYAAALAGFTAALIAADAFGATGGLNADVFLLAVWRATEIIVGITCGVLILAGTDLDDARRRLATSLASLAADVACGWIHMLHSTRLGTPETQTETEELLRRVIALEPMIDQTIGESDHIRYRASTLRTAVDGLLRTLAAWRCIASHVGRSPNDLDKQWAETVLQNTPSGLSAAMEPASSLHRCSEPLYQRGLCEEAASRLQHLPARTPSLRLLIDEAIEAYDGMSDAFNGLAMLVDASGYAERSSDQGVRPTVPDWLPALCNAFRAFVVIVSLEMFWIATAWPSGANAIVFAAIGVLLFAPQGDRAYGGSIALTIGTVFSITAAALIKFAFLPAFQSFTALCIGIGLVLVPAGFSMAHAQHHAVGVVFTAMVAMFMLVLDPANLMSYDTERFYNFALSAAIGCMITPLAFWLIPPLSPELRTRRLLGLTLRDLRHLATRRRFPTTNDWRRLIHSRLAALPDSGRPDQRAELQAALSVGVAVVGLRSAHRQLAKTEIDSLLDALAHGSNSFALGRLHQLDHDLTPDSGDSATLRARARFMIISDALTRYPAYFAGRSTA